MSSAVLAIDFDGPLCDSAAGMQGSAWRAAQVLWPDVMRAAAEVPLRKTGVRSAWVGRKWEELEGVVDAGQPAWLRAKMEQLWPVCGREEDGVMLMRLCADEAIASERSARGSRPLTVGEIVASWDADLRDALLARYDTSSCALTQACDEESARWLGEDREGWARAHALQPAVAEMLRAGDADDGERRDVRLLCCNRGRTREVLRHAGLERAAPPLIEAASRGEKVEALVGLTQEHPSHELAFVDDDAQMLRCAGSDLRLLRWSLHFAGWGYSTPAQAALVARMPRVRVLSDAAELAQLASGADSGVE